MTDAEWLACDDPRIQLNLWLQKKNRKVRLAAVAACRAFWDFLTDERISGHVTDEHRREASESLAVAERFADGLATEEELEAAWERAEAVSRALRDAIDAFAAGDYDMDDMRVGDAQEVTDAIGWAASTSPERTFSPLRGIPGLEFLVARALREVFGPPTPPSFSRAWLTPTVTAVAQGVYADRAFDRLPVLADALEDAGCTDASILDHCRSGDEHARGCWVLDLLLAKG
jgi:hypothetical protein